LENPPKSVLEAERKDAEARVQGATQTRAQEAIAQEDVVLHEVAGEEDDNFASVVHATAGGARHRHNGKYYKVRIGKRGGKYIVVGTDKKKIYV
jgi:hypothetical protein